jgi:dCTP deaminase
VLSDQGILDAMRSGEISVTGAAADALQPASLDVRLGNEFLLRRHDEPQVLLDPCETDSGPLFSEVFVGPDERLAIRPGDFVLATTMETFRLGASVVAQLEGKSSLARLGVLVHQTAGFIDPGFHGTITLEISVAANFSVLLRPGMAIAQVAFMRMSQPAQALYHGRYDGQSGPTPSRYFMGRRSTST